MPLLSSTYELRLHAYDLIYDVLPFGRLWYGEPSAIENRVCGASQPLTRCRDSRLRRRQSDQSLEWGLDPRRFDCVRFHASCSKISSKNLCNRDCRKKYLKAPCQSNSSHEDRSQVVAGKGQRNRLRTRTACLAAQL